MPGDGNGRPGWGGHRKRQVVALPRWYWAPDLSCRHVADYPSPADALAYVLDGWPVVQVDRHGKRVSSNGWSSTAKPITDPEYIRRAGCFLWPGCSPGGHNIGGVLGRGPRARLGLDDDPAEGSEETISRWVAKGCSLPPTRTHRTPSGGRHLIYLAPEGTRGGKLGDGLMVRGWGPGGGSYIVLPPSVVVDGEVCGTYTVFDDRPEVPAPGWLLEWLTSHSALAHQGSGNPLEHADGQQFCACVACLVPEPTGDIPTAIDRFLDQGPRAHDVSGQVLWFLANCLEHGMSAGKALWITVQCYQPAKVRYGADVDREVRRILGKLAPRHQHPGQACDRAGCPHRPEWMGGGGRS